MRVKSTSLMKSKTLASAAGLLHFGGGDGKADIACVAFRDARGTHVSAVDRKTGGNFRLRVAQAVEREVAGAALGQRNMGQPIGEHIELTGQSNPHNQLSAAVSKIRKVNLGIDKVSVNALQSHGDCRFYKEAIHEICEIQPVVPHTAHSRGSRSEPVRIFSITTYREPWGGSFLG